MSTVKFVPRDPIVPIFGIKLSPLLHRTLNSISEKRQLEVLKEIFQIDPKRVVAIKSILDQNNGQGTMIVIFNYIYDKMMPKYEIPHNEDGSFKFKVYDIDFNKDINIEELLEQVYN